MKNVLLLVVAVVFSSTLNAQLNINFTNQFDSPEPSTAWASGQDAAGNVYAVGRFKTNVDLDPTAGVNNQPTTGPYDLYDMYVVKMNSSGAVQWSYVFGSERTDYVGDVAVSAAGDVYITGRFSGTMDADFGAGTQNITASDVYDAFVIKVNTSGAFQWVQQYSGTGAIKAESITVDSNGDVVVAGTFNGDCSDGATTLNTVGSNDIWISKLSNAGTPQYLYSMGGPDTELVKVVESSGTDVYIGGLFGGTSNLNTTGTTNLTSTGAGDAYIVKLDATGNTLYSGAFGGAGGDDELNAISVLSTGEIVIGGRFVESADLDPTGGVANVVSNSVADAYITKLDANGNYIWSYTYGDQRGNNVYGLAVDGTDNIYAGGWFNDNVDFDNGAGVSVLNAASGNVDSYVLKIDSNGNYLDVDHLDASSDVVIRDVNIIGNSLVISGEMGGTADFDFNAGVTNLSNNVFSGNGFVAKYNF